MPLMCFLSCFWRDYDAWTIEIFILTYEKTLLEILLEKGNTKLIDQISKNSFKKHGIIHGFSLYLLIKDDKPSKALLMTRHLDTLYGLSFSS